MALVTLSTVSANKEKKCLVKSGKDSLVKSGKDKALLLLAKVSTTASAK